MSFFKKIKELKRFKSITDKIDLLSIALDLPKLNFDKDISHDIDWPDAFLFASILTKSDEEEDIALALRIASTFILDQKLRSHKVIHSDDFESACAHIFNSLTNFPVLNLAVAKGLLNPETSTLSFFSKADSLKKKIAHTITIGEEELFLNKFQIAVLKDFRNFQNISISGSTSVGKTFALKVAVRDFLTSNASAKIGIIVPTRALINQVEKDFHILSNTTKGLIVRSTPSLPGNWKTSPIIFVLTQERLDWLLNDTAKDFMFDLLISDEAHKISDDYRGILLQQSISKSLLRNSNQKLFFSSPLVKNPSIFLENLEKEKSSVVDMDYVSVFQNLFWVNQKRGTPKTWEVELCKGSTKKIANIELDENPNNIPQKIALLVLASSQNESSNIIYANGASDAEKYALEIASRVKIENKSGEVQDLIDLVKKSIHKNYYLAECLKKGVAFHYGNMPSLIRLHVESLFEKGIIQYLVCTSTLIEGVNLPAKNIYLRGPKKGRKTPMNESDFWNLAGRAGRLGKEFSGNIFCIDTRKQDVWKNGAPRSKNKYFVSISSKLSNQKIERLNKYINDDTPREEYIKENILDYQLTFYLFHLKNDGNLDKFKVSDNPAFNSEMDKFSDKLNEMIDDKDGIPYEIIERNPGISPYAMKNLLNRFKEYTTNYDELIPVNPKERDALQTSYIELIARISKYLTGDHPGRNFYHALIVVNWMRGMPYNYIISGNIKHWDDKYVDGKLDKKKAFDAVIRETLFDIENYARFKFQKYSSCYIDILRYFFEQKGLEHLIPKIPNLKLWVEFGSSYPTQISLISIGLSRSTAIAVSKEIGDMEKEEAFCLNWLKAVNLDDLNLSTLQKLEVSELLNRR
tara:strand:- start:357 stop:2939 length:2583 start_codon:yes stop_codon:yes gene_type:complete